MRVNEPLLDKNRRGALALRLANDACPSATAADARGMRARRGGHRGDHARVGGEYALLELLRARVRRQPFA